MGTTLRALRALLLLAGFYLLGVLLLAVLAGADYLLFLHAPTSLAGKLIIVSVLLAIPLVRGLFMLRTPRDEEMAGLPVTESDEPELWRTVRELADEVGTTAPSRIVLTADVNAAVAEDARLLGLRPGPRRLYLGVPLLQGLSQAQLRAVLAHELGDRVEDAARAQRAVAHAGEARADRVHLGGPAHPAVLAQHDVLGVLRAGQPDLLLDDLGHELEVGLQQRRVVVGAQVVKALEVRPDGVAERLLDRVRPFLDGDRGHG